MLEMEWKLRIISSSEVRYDGGVEMVVVPGSEGEIGILPNHSNMIVELKSGDVKIYNNNSIEQTVSITSGVVVISKNGVDILLRE
jgi:F-type H+-transporting ATPase subunit epsilon